MHDTKFLAIRRRGFLALVPACALTSGLWPSHLAAAEYLQRLTPADPGDVLTVGYWPGSAALARLDGLRYATEAADPDDATRDPATDSELERADLIPAETLDRGDPRFARAGARVRLHGMFPVEDRPADDLASLSLDVSFQPFHDTMFHAWGFENGALPCVRPGTAFTVPIDGASGLTLAFDIAETGERCGQETSPTGSSEDPKAGTTRVVTRFSLGREPQTAKLRRGVYFVAWRGPSAKPLRSWRRYRILSRDVEAQDGVGSDACHFHLVRRRDERTPTDATFAVLSVDYADHGDTV